MISKRFYFSKLSAGMSLIELLTVVSIIMILTAVASPFLGTLMSKYQAEAAGYHILATLKYCRSEGINRKNNVSCVIEGSLADKNVKTTVYVDNNANGSFEQAADLLLSSSVMSNTSFLKMTPASSTFTYNRQGMSSNTSLQTMVLCATIAGATRKLNTIFVDAQGAPFVQGAAHDETC